MVVRRVLGVVVVLFALAPSAGWSSHCASRIVVFSRNDVQRTAGVGAVNANAVACEAAEVEAADTRLITPAATEITVRYTLDVGVPTLTAVVTGLGFDNAALPLTRSIDSTTGLYSYRSAAVSIPAGAAASGVVRVRISHPALPGGSDTVCFHTWNAAC